MLLMIILSIINILVLGYIIVNILKNPTTSDKILSIFTAISISVFLFLFIVFLFNTLSLPNKGFSFIWHKEIASSIHYALNAMTSGQLIDMGVSTKILLESILSKNVVLYIITGFYLLIAPLCTAAWLISLFNTNFWTGLRILIIRGIRKKVLIFYDISEKSILTATYLKPQIKKKQMQTVFCRSSMEAESRFSEMIPLIRDVGGICIRGTENDYQLNRDKNSMIICSDSLLTVSDYFRTNKKLEEVCGKCFIITYETEEEGKLIEQAHVGVLRPNVSMETEFISIWETIAATIMKDISNKANCTVIGDGSLYNILLNNLYNILLNKEKGIKGINQVKTLYDDIENAIKKKGDGGERYIIFASNDIDSSIKLKRKLQKSIKSAMNQYQIYIYVDVLYKKTLEKVWENNNGMKESICVGAIEEVLQDIVKNRIIPSM